ncbi:MAG: type II toxin-antitoxin system VapB family antitoxin [Desulfosporosinus sp.]
METAKLFVNGQSQAVRLPKEYRFSGNEVYIQKVGNTVMLFPKERAWETFLNGLNSFSDDFFAGGRNQGVQEPRETL